MKAHVACGSVVGERGLVCPDVSSVRTGAQTSNEAELRRSNQYRENVALTRYVLAARF
jgi:hypothetical protein